MKDIIVLEINGKKGVLGNIEIKTPNEYLLINRTEPVLNNRIFDDFIDEIFVYITEELSNQFNEKIKNVYITFLNDNSEFVCSIVLDKMKPKRGTYRMSVIDWTVSGHTFKYADNEDEE